MDKYKAVGVFNAQWFYDLETTVKELDDRNLLSQFLLLKEKQDFKSINAFGDSLKSTNIKINQQFKEFWSGQFKKSKSLKFVKGVALIGGGIFVVDAVGEIWAYFDDQPRPFKVPGKIPVDMLGEGLKVSADIFRAAIQEKDLKTVLDEKSRGSAEELIDETQPKKKDH